MTAKSKRTRQRFTAEFKAQMVSLYESGKSRSDLIREYQLTESALSRWIKQSQSTGSFKEKDNRSDKDEQLLLLQKQNKQLLMENDILKQAALIFGRR